MKKRQTKNLLTLHEAIAIVLLGKDKRTATIDQIADEINARGLYIRKDEKSLPAYQVMQRTKLSNGSYRHLFQFTEPGWVTLK